MTKNMAYDNKKIIAEAMEHFNHLVKYSTDGKLNEDNNMAAPQQDGMPGTDDGTMPDPSQDPNQDPTQAGQPAPGGDQQMPADGQADGGQSQGVPGLQSQDDMADPSQAQDATQQEPDQGMDMSGEQDDLASQEEEDTDEITDKLDHFQKETSAEIKSMKSSFDELKSLLSRFETGLESNKEGIESLQRELEKRAPDSIEKMGLRREKSGPFTDTPDNYWNTEAPDNYSADDDEDGVGEERYKITGKDIDDITDWNEIAKSLNGKEDEEAEKNKSLSGIFGL